MARHARTFTLSPETARAIDELAEKPANDKLLVELLKNAPVDEYRLVPNDYEALYKLLPSNTKNSKLPRTPEGRVFMLHVSLCGDAHPNLYKQVANEMNKLARKNKPASVNVSRVADALLTRAITSLYERVTVSEAAASSRSNAKESRYKLSNGNGRKAAAI